MKKLFCVYLLILVGQALELGYEFEEDSATACPRNYCKENPCTTPVSCPPNHRLIPTYCECCETCVPAIPLGRPCGVDELPGEARKVACEEGTLCVDNVCKTFG